MTKNEFKAALEHAEELIKDVNNIFYRITREASLSQDKEDEEDVEDLQDALLDMFPTGWSTPADKIFDEYSNLFDDDFGSQA